MLENKEFLLLQLKVSDLQQLIKDAVNEEPQKNEKVILLKPKSDFQVLITPKKVMSLLKVSRSQLYHWNKNGKLPALKINNRVYYDDNMIWNIYWTGEF